MSKATELLKENQWCRRSPSLSKPNAPVMTCPVCCMLQENQIHDDGCWLGQALTELEKQPDLVEEMRIKMCQWRNKYQGIGLAETHCPDHTPLLEETLSNTRLALGEKEAENERLEGELQLLKQKRVRRIATQSKGFTGKSKS